MWCCAPASKQTYFATRPIGKTYVEKVEEYKLQAGDVIQIRINSLTQPEFNFMGEASSQIDARIDPLLAGYPIADDGTVVIPAVGPVNIAALTVREAQNKLVTILQDYLDTPSVSVRLVSFHFAVVGEVMKQGKYGILEDRINIFEALSMAGGLTEFANFETVKVLRTENGVSTLHSINLLDPNIPSSNYYHVIPNDVIIVDQLKNKNFRKNSASNIALILSALGTAVTIILAVDNFSD